MGGKDIGLSKWRESKAGRSRIQPALNRHEQAVFDALRADGWDVYRNGWPDFLAVKGDQIRLVEVKSPNDRLKVEQRRVHRVLERFGLRVEVVRPELEPNHPNHGTDGHPVP